MAGAGSQGGDADEKPRLKGFAFLRAEGWVVAPSGSRLCWLEWSQEAARARLCAMSLGASAGF